MTLVYDNSETWYRPIETPKANWLPSALILTVVLISFRPFSSGYVPQIGEPLPQQQGDIANQIGFGLVGLFCAALLIKRSCSSVLTASLHPAWVLLTPVLFMSVVSSDNPMASFRAMMFSLIVVMAAFTALSLPRNLPELVQVLAISCGIALVFSYLAVFFVPAQGVHAGEIFEVQHTGLWKGVYDHKNVAAYVMGSFTIIGWFVARNGKPVAGALLILFSLVFVVQAGSKTVLGILPATILAAMIAHWVSWRPIKFLVVVTPVLILTAVTLGSVIYDPILTALQSVFPGLTYTGRLDLWIFGIEHASKAPWLGYGFESFWSTPRVIGLEQPIELSWDVRGIVHGHNSWLDSALAFGVPGALILFGALVILPVWDYLRIPASGNAGRLADLYIAIWMFTALGACLESFFFRRADPVWFCMLIAVVGLRLTAHMTTHHNRAPMDQ
ncbi:MAG: O-antigen ligase family protein [Rhizobiaceae bacterium]